MSTTAKNAILKALIDGIITELMIKSTGDNIYIDETTTLSSKIADMVLAINARPTASDVTSQINALKQELLGDTPIEAYNTFTELAQYINDHQDVYEALSASVTNKADKSVVDAIQTTINGLGSLATKSKVTESDLDTTLANKINNASAGNHSHDNKTVLDGITSTKVTNWDTASKNSHTHSNKTVLDNITSAKVVNWDAKAKLYVQASQPTDLTANDLWIQTL